MKYSHDASYITIEAETVAEQRLLQNIYGNIYRTAGEVDSEQIMNAELPDVSPGLDLDIEVIYKLELNLTPIEEVAIVD